MNSPLVSIIMPAYNTQRYIEESIKSVLCQTYHNWELLVVDDYSTDNTKKIINELSKNDCRIKPIFNTTNSGTPARAKNKALPRVKGKYIAFLDSDDLWMRDKLRQQIHYMEKNIQFALTYTGGYHIDNNGYKVNDFMPKYKHGDILYLMLRKYEINNQSVVIKTQALFDTIKLFDETIIIGEDYNLFMHIVAKYKIANIKDYLVKYRVHAESITKNKNLDLSTGTLKTLKELNIKYKIKRNYPLYYAISWLRVIRLKVSYWVFSY